MRATKVGCTLGSSDPGSSDRLDRIEQKLNKLAADNEKFNDKFSNYQNATQWAVQLAFTLIASATVTVIITSVLRK